MRPGLMASFVKDVTGALRRCRRPSHGTESCKMLNVLRKVGTSPLALTVFSRSSFDKQALYEKCMQPVYVYV